MMVKDSMIILDQNYFLGDHSSVNFHPNCCNKIVYNTNFDCRSLVSKTKSHL